MAQEMDNSLIGLLQREVEPFIEGEKKGAAFRKILREAGSLKGTSDRFFVIALFQILDEHEIHPSSGDILEAYKRADESLKLVEP